MKDAIISALVTVAAVALIYWGLAEADLYLLRHSLPHYADNGSFIPNRDEAWVVRISDDRTPRLFITPAVPQWNEQAKRWEPSPSLESAIHGDGWTRNWYRTEAEARASVGLDMIDNPQRKDGE